MLNVIATRNKMAWKKKSEEPIEEDETVEELQKRIAKLEDKTKKVKEEVVDEEPEEEVVDEEPEEEVIEETKSKKTKNKTETDLTLNDYLANLESRVASLEAAIYRLRNI